MWPVVPSINVQQLVVARVEPAILPWLRRSESKPMNDEGALTCRECGSVTSVPFGIMDELGGVHTCEVCRRDLHPEEELNSDEAPVVEV
jgi:hypothetical protein